MHIRTNQWMEDLRSRAESISLAGYSWPENVEAIVRGGWTVRESGAVVLSHIASGFNHEEHDYPDLTTYETRVNQIYVPDQFVDLSSSDTAAELVARGEALMRILLDETKTVDSPPMMAILNIGVWFEGKFGGNIHLHRVRTDERPWVRVDALEGYRQEAVMVINTSQQLNHRTLEL